MSEPSLVTDIVIREDAERRFEKPELILGRQRFRFSSPFIIY